MARILYAINGDGMGHTIRSLAILEELSKRHTIKIIVGSKRCYDVIKKHDYSVVRISGPALAYKENAVADFLTFNRTAKNFIKYTPSNFRKIYRTIEHWKPDLIITDFDSSTIYISDLFDVPLVCLCNIHAVSELDFHVPQKYVKDYHKARFVIDVLAPRADHHIITSFFDYPIKKNRSYKNTVIVPPVLRREILSLKPRRCGHILVYQTSDSNKDLLRLLKCVDKKFVVYGFNKELVDGNITFRLFNEKQFFKDFKDCDAVITNGGFTFITEAIHLQKPLLCVPIKGQFEQILNALEVKKANYGVMCDKLTKFSIEKFLKDIPSYYRALAKNPKTDNSAAIKRIEVLLKSSSSKNKS